MGHATKVLLCVVLLSLFGFSATASTAPLPNANLICTGKTADGRSVNFQAFVQNQQPSPSQPTQVELATSDLLIQVGGRTVENRKSVQTMISYITSIGGYVGSINFGADSFYADWALWNDGADLSKNQFTLAKDPTDHNQQREELGLLACVNAR